MPETMKIQNVAIDSIRENPVALRSVNRESESYQGIVESIKLKGFIGTISVRPMKDADSGESYFELVDGLHRFNAARDAGLTEIPCTIMELSKQECMEAQVMMNLHKVETKPVEFTRQLQRMFAHNPTLTMTEMATRLGKSASWITTRLGLLKLDDKIQSLVDEGKITLSNAFALTKLDAEEQVNFVDSAMTTPPAEFAPAVNARVKEIREAKKSGKDPSEAGFAPHAFMQKKGDIETELASLEVVGQLISESKAKTAVDGAKIALEWVLNLDAKSVAIQQAKYDERQAKAREAAERRKVERAKKKEEEAAKERAELEEKYKAAPNADTDNA